MKKLKITKKEGLKVLEGLRMIEEWYQTHKNKVI
jgi:hypothetical protein